MEADANTRLDAITLVCFALAEEAAPFRRLIRERSAVHVVVTGMGLRNARQAFEKALAGCHPERVITCGYAGGLNPALAYGQVVFDADENFDWRPALVKLGAKPVRFHCSPRIITGSPEKLRLHGESGFDAVEMESEVIRQICRERGIPSATVRVISDTAHQNLPLDFNRFLTPEQKMDTKRVALAALRHPDKIPALWAFGRKTRAAAACLGQFLKSLLTQ